MIFSSAIHRTDPLAERTNDGKMNDYNLPIYTIHISSTLNSRKMLYIHVEMKNILVERSSFWQKTPFHWLQVSLLRGVFKSRLLKTYAFHACIKVNVFKNKRK